MNPQNSIKLVGLLGALLMTFGITYFDFETFTNPTNIKPGLMMGLGIIAIAYFVLIKRNAAK
jgi:hypothetical protein